MQEKKRLQMPKTWVQNFGSFTRSLGSQEMPLKKLLLCLKKKIIHKITKSY